MSVLIFAANGTVVSQRFLTIRQFHALVTHLDETATLETVAHDMQHNVYEYRYALATGHFVFITSEG